MDIYVLYALLSIAALVAVCIANYLVVKAIAVVNETERWQAARSRAVIYRDGPPPEDNIISEMRHSQGIVYAGVIVRSVVCIGIFVGMLMIFATSTDNQTDYLLGTIAGLAGYFPLRALFVSSKELRVLKSREANMSQKLNMMIASQKNLDR